MPLPPITGRLFYDVDLGAPKGARYVWKNLIRRDFANGIVLLNPPGQPTVATDLEGTYQDSDGKILTKLALAGKQGSVLLNATPVTPQAPPVMLNVCGQADGQFGADQYFESGRCDKLTQQVVVPPALSGVGAAIYQKKRTTSAGETGFSYTVSNLVPGFAYHLQLHFADDISQTPGHRLFNVIVNGKTALSEFDIFKTAGARSTAVVQDIFGVQADPTGAITIQFQNIKGNAIVNAIALMP